MCLLAPPSWMCVVLLLLRRQLLRVGEEGEGLSGGGMGDASLFALVRVIS